MLILVLLDALHALLPGRLSPAWEFTPQTSTQCSIANASSSDVRLSLFDLPPNST